MNTRGIFTLSKRAAEAYDIITNKGYVTTTDLLNLGYTETRRAIQDLKDAGVPMVKISNPDRSVFACYTFGDLSTAKPNVINRTSSKKVKSLLELVDNHCQICKIDGSKFALQADHKVPISIDPQSNEYQLLCRSCNCEKRQACKSCSNQNAETCKTCYWASPNNYSHIETHKMKRTVIIELEQI